MPESTCHAGEMSDAPSPPPETRRSRLWDSAAARGVPLAAILTAVGVVVVVYLSGRIIYKLRDILLLMLVAGFIALLLNPLVVALQRWRVPRRGFAVALVTLWAVLVFIGLAVLFGYPLVNGLTNFAHTLPNIVNQAQHGQWPIGHLVRLYHIHRELDPPQRGAEAVGLRQEPLQARPQRGQGRHHAHHLALRHLHPGPAAPPGGPQAPPRRAAARRPGTGRAHHRRRRSGEPLGDRLHARELHHVADRRDRGVRDAPDSSAFPSPCCSGCGWRSSTSCP